MSKCLPAILLTILFAQFAEAQVKNPVVKLHSFRREIVPGIKPDGPQEKNYRYYLYIESKPGTTIKVQEVWINFKKQTFATAVRKSPVKMDNPVVYAEAAKNIAVPATRNIITEIIIEGEMEGKTPDKSVAPILAQNAAVVRLTYQGRIFNIPVKEFREREQLFLQ